MGDDHQIYSISFPGTSSLLTDNEIDTYIEKGKTFLNDRLEGKKAQKTVLNEMLEVQRLKKAVARKHLELKAAKKKEFIKRTLLKKCQERLNLAEKECKYNFTEFERKYGAERTSKLLEEFEEKIGSCEPKMKLELDRKTKQLEKQEDLSAVCVTKNYVRTATGRKISLMVLKEPCIVYRLSDEEIEEDFSLFTKVLMKSSKK